MVGLCDAEYKVAPDQEEFSHTVPFVMSMNENRLLHSEFIKYEQNSRDKDSLNEYKMSNLSVRIAVWIVVSSSAFFGYTYIHVNYIPLWIIAHFPFFY